MKMSKVFAGLVVATFFACGATSWADGTFITSISSNPKWETVSWNISGDSGGQVFPGDVNGDGTEDAKMLHTVTNNLRSMTINGAVSWAYAIDDLAFDFSPTGTDNTREFDFKAANTGTLTLNSMTMTHSSQPDYSLIFNAGDTNKIKFMNTTGMTITHDINGPLNFIETPVEFTGSLTVRGSGKVVFDDNADDTIVQNMTGTLTLGQTTGGSTNFYYRKLGVNGDTIPGYTFGALAVESGADALLTYAIGGSGLSGSVRYADFSANGTSFAGGNLTISTDDKTKVLLGDVTYSGTNTLKVLRPYTTNVIAGWQWSETLSSGVGDSLEVEAYGTLNLDTDNSGGG